MADYLFPSSYRCDCGHESHFFERTVQEMRTESERRARPIHLADSEEDEHEIEFHRGTAVAVICPKLGRCEITDLV